MRVATRRRRNHACRDNSASRPLSHISLDRSRKFGSGDLSTFHQFCPGHRTNYEADRNSLGRWRGGHHDSATDGVARHRHRLRRVAHVPWRGFGGNVGFVGTSAHFDQPPPTGCSGGIRGGGRYHRRDDGTLQRCGDDDRRRHPHVGDVIGPECHCCTTGGRPIAHEHIEPDERTRQPSDIGFPLAVIIGGIRSRDERRGGAL